MKHKETFSIRQLVEITGLTEFTIRGWEGRYSAFRPQRGTTGRREYSKADVERAILLRELIKRGQRISQLTSLANNDLQKLFNYSEPTVIRNKNTPSDSKIVSNIMARMALQKWEELEQIIDGVSFKNSNELIENFFLPVLRQLSENIDAGLVSISQEHVMSCFLKEKAYVAISKISKKRKKRKPPSKKIRFILATPEGDHHEIGLILAHLLIRSYGFTSLCMGTHTPAKDLAETTLRFGGSHVLVVTTVSEKGGARSGILTYVNTIQKLVSTNTQIAIAGRQAPVIEWDGTTSLFRIANFQELENYLTQLGGSL